MPSACDEITISLWVYRSPVPAAPAAKPARSNEEVGTLKMIIATTIQVLMVIATIAFVHQNLYYVVSKCILKRKHRRLTFSMKLDLSWFRRTTKMQNDVQDGGVRGTAVGGGTGYSASVGARHKNNAGSRAVKEVVIY
jgi:hypothetical protein